MKSSVYMMQFPDLLCITSIPSLQKGEKKEMKEERKTRGFLEKKKEQSTIFYTSQERML